MSDRLHAALMLLAAVGTAAYWTAYFTSGSGRTGADPGYLAFEGAFPLADGYMTACFLVAAGLLWAGRAAAVPFGIAAGSAMVFLGCMDVLFNLEHGKYTAMTPVMTVETAINVGCLVFGPLTMVRLWRGRHRMRERPGMRGVLAAVAALALVAPVAAAECLPSVPGTTAVRSLAAAGDSITKGFNAHRTGVADTELFCPNADQEEYGWATGDTNGTDFCSAGDEGVFSLTERLECRADANVRSPRPNQARSGARMLTDFVTQAHAIRAYLCARRGPRLATVFLGHNDVCSGTVDKEPGCEHGADEDPDDYCRTTPAAFERQFRKGLDVLVTLPDTRIAVASLVRVSQLCNHRDKRQCQTIAGGPCHELWEAVDWLGDTFGAVFGLEGGICGSLTKDCEDPGRIAAAYHTARAYHDILERVTREYGEVPEGAPSPVVEIAGQVVGGATRAPGTTLVFSDAPWVYRFDGDQISCCDCFHPSARGQNLLARVLRRGLRCSRTTPCCANVDDPRCAAVDRSGRLYPGFF